MKQVVWPRGRLPWPSYQDPSRLVLRPAGVRGPERFRRFGPAMSGEPDPVWMTSLKIFAPTKDEVQSAKGVL